MPQSLSILFQEESQVSETYTNELLQDSDTPTAEDMERLLRSHSLHMQALRKRQSMEKQRFQERLLKKRAEKQQTEENEEAGQNDKLRGQQNQSITDNDKSNIHSIKVGGLTYTTLKNNEDKNGKTRKNSTGSTGSSGSTGKKRKKGAKDEERPWTGSSESDKDSTRKSNGFNNSDSEEDEYKVCIFKYQIFIERITSLGRLNKAPFTITYILQPPHGYQGCCKSTAIKSVPRWNFSSHNFSRVTYRFFLVSNQGDAFYPNTLLVNF